MVNLANTLIIQQRLASFENSLPGKEIPFFQVLPLTTGPGRREEGGPGLCGYVTSSESPRSGGRYRCRHLSPALHQQSTPRGPRGPTLLHAAWKHSSNSPYFGVIPAWPLSRISRASLTTPFPPPQNTVSVGLRLTFCGDRITPPGCRLLRFTASSAPPR